MRSKLICFVVGTCFLFPGCGENRVPSVSDPTARDSATPKPPIELIDISKSPPLASKGRFQDGATADGTPNYVADEIVANGKDSIPFLIGKLEDETEMDRTIINFWNELYVGDMALLMLTDLFTDRSDAKSTVPGFSWDEFLERGDDRSVTGEEILRKYLRKYGRQAIRHRWQEMWESNKEKIFWDAACNCFRLRSEKAPAR